RGPPPVRCRPALAVGASAKIGDPQGQAAASRGAGPTAIGSTALSLGEEAQPTRVVVNRDHVEIVHRDLHKMRMGIILFSYPSMSWVMPGRSSSAGRRGSPVFSTISIEQSPTLSGAHLDASALSMIVRTSRGEISVKCSGPRKPSTTFA